MWCMKCGKDLSECICPDIDERLKSLQGGHVMVKYCMKCDKHYARCKCENPVWGVR